MKYLLIEMIDPNHPVILNENPGSDKPLILTGTKTELETLMLENSQKGMLMPITFDLLGLMEDLFNFIFMIKSECEEDIDMGKSGVVNGPDCLEQRIEEYIFNIEK